MNGAGGRERPAAMATGAGGRGRGGHVRARRCRGNGTRGLAPVPVAVLLWRSCSLRAHQNARLLGRSACFAGARQK